MTRYMEIAQTIWQQLLMNKWGIMAWGIESRFGQKDVEAICSPNGDIYSHPALGTLRLLVNNTAVGRKAWVYISLNGMDTYDILIFRKKTTRKEALTPAYAELTHKYENIYFDEMFEVIDNALIGKDAPMKFNPKPELN